MSPEFVGVAVVGHPQPVGAPHVLPPSDHLADEPFGRRNGHIAAAIGGLHGVTHLVGTQQSQVQVRRQQGVGKVPAGRQHGVLVRPEHRQHLGDGVVQPTQRLTTGRGPGAIRISPPTRCRQPIEHGAVGGIERRDRRGRPRPAIGWRGFPVVGVKVPPVPGRLVTVHEVPQSAALEPVEVLHAQQLATTGPLGEIIAMAKEVVRRHRHHPEIIQHALTIK